MLPAFSPCPQCFQKASFSLLSDTGNLIQRLNEDNSYTVFKRLLCTGSSVTVYNVDVSLLLSA